MANMFKENKSKLELLTNVDMLLMVEKGIREGICHAIHRYAKANNKYMKNYDKSKNHYIFSIYMQTICTDGQCIKKCLEKKNMLKFNEDFLKNYDEDSDKGYILEVGVKYPKRLHKDL